MIRKKKRRFGKVRAMVPWVIALAIVGCTVWQRGAFVSLWRNVDRAMHVPDVTSALHSLHRDTFGVLCMTPEGAGDDCYLFDSDGVVFGAARTVVGDSIARIDDASPFRPAIGKPFIDGAAWKNLSVIVAAVRSGDVTVSAAHLKRAEREIDMVLAPSGTTAYFSLEFSPERHIRAVRELMRRIRLDTLEYIDLRVEGKIFYLPKVKSVSGAHAAFLVS